MPNPFYSDYPETSQATKPTEPEIEGAPLRGDDRTKGDEGGGAGPGRVGTYTHPKSGTPRKVFKTLGRRVKTSMLENY